MPLLLCPNDNISMQTVDRGGVQFDMCPTCRGVWLDRGELEKLMAASAHDAPAPPAQGGQFGTPQPWASSFGGRGEYGERGEHGERGDYGHGYGGHKRRRGSIFDIFD